MSEDKYGRMKLRGISDEDIAKVRSIDEVDSLSTNCASALNAWRKDPSSKERAEAFVNAAAKFSAAADGTYQFACVEVAAHALPATAKRK